MIVITTPTGDSAEPRTPQASTPTSLSAVV
jgi:hypothetical protein